MTPLERLRERYRLRIQERGVRADEMLDVLREIYSQRVRNLMMAMISSCLIADWVSSQAMDPSVLTPEMTEAFHLQYPHLTFDDLRRMSPAELQGVVNGWSGKLFEVMVRDMLNKGEWVGDIHLQPGQHAVLADSPTQPGWDIRIVNADGSTDELLQLKATSSLSYVKAAIEQHPNIHVIATSDVFDHGTQLSDALLDHVTNSGIGEDMLREFINDTLSGNDTRHHFLEALEPGLPLLMILAQELRQVRAGSKSAKAAKKEAFTRLLKSGSISLVTHGLHALGATTGITVPVSFLMRTGMTRISVFNQLTYKLEKRTQELQKWYQMSTWNKPPERSFSYGRSASEHNT
ncbi:conserved hypothetical protein [Alicyclobacillus acidocaldarius subsp. acidocaldarius DSM 446]|uniref:Uncharacterized protein n=2 Tax=Alicyclobacillus acidocaldarius TaxID=405212 RepID=C8WPX8_ALIAD|nr:conserved hypothetical protein [Alicyclobacillus acidocaldarius subsp. acidocaldarius DSM 446]